MRIAEYNTPLGCMYLFIFMEIVTLSEIKHKKTNII